ncbi:MAG: hypothetical protein J0L75_11060 [Spirochaetes bacterium]|nr:hypothetical protein [Spirochaetota bacterium]
MSTVFCAGFFFASWVAFLVIPPIQILRSGKPLLVDQKWLVFAGALGFIPFALQSAVPASGDLPLEIKLLGWAIPAVFYGFTVVAYFGLRRKVLQGLGKEDLEALVAQSVKDAALKGEWKGERLSFPSGTRLILRARRGECSVSAKLFSSAPEYRALTGALQARLDGKAWKIHKADLYMRLGSVALAAILMGLWFFFSKGRLPI